MTNQTSPPDDLEAVRIIVSTLKAFSSKDDQERIIRWSREKLNLSLPSGTPPSAAPSPPSAQPQRVSKDIKTFIGQKKPRSDTEFAATVAYYYRFEAPESERKEEIYTEDLQEAARKADHERLHRPIDTLHNAFKRGLLDKGGAKGSFKINTVGENLVAMTLPLKEQDKAKSAMSHRRKPEKTKTSRKRRR